MPALPPTELLTPRLQLRAPENGDAADLLEMHASPDVMRHSNSLPWTTVDQAQGLITSARAWAQSGRHLCLCIVERSSGRVVGTCTLFDITHEHRRAELGFLLSDRVWRRGYMSEALAALIGHAFGALDLDRIEADTDPGNVAAIGLLESLGFVREGLLRQRWVVGGRKSDAAMYGLLRDDAAPPR